MIIALVFMIIAFIITFIHCSEDFKWYGKIDYEMVVLGLFMSFAISLLGAMAGLGIAFSLPANNETVTKQVELVSLQDNSSTEGHFLLGCGSIDGKMKYTYYYEVEEGAYKMAQKDIDDVIIKFWDKTPILETKTVQMDDSFWNWFAMDMPIETHIFYVPQGTIKNDYNLDAQ